VAKPFYSWVKPPTPEQARRYNDERAKPLIKLLRSDAPLDGAARREIARLIEELLRTPREEKKRRTERDNFNWVASYLAEIENLRQEGLTVEEAMKRVVKENKLQSVAALEKQIKRVKKGPLGSELTSTPLFEPWEEPYFEPWEDP
jgi:hypothetical protein